MNAETIREAEPELTAARIRRAKAQVDGGSHFSSPENWASDRAEARGVLNGAALAYASLLDGTHPEMMLVRRDVPSITVQIGHLVLAVGGPLNEIEDGKWTSKPPGRYVRVDGP